MAGACGDLTNLLADETWRAWGSLAEDAARDARASRWLAGLWALGVFVSAVMVPLLIYHSGLDAWEDPRAFNA